MVSMTQKQAYGRQVHFWVEAYQNFTPSLLRNNFGLAFKECWESTGF